MPTPRIEMAVSLQELFSGFERHRGPWDIFTDTKLRGYQTVQNRPPNETEITQKNVS